ncbi:MAG: hypothetical protein HY475_03575 [Candidatus Terrybacteria bacterium]|nr:hypothetical protein [Candidatus Terrybacteria bacterium]
MQERFREPVVALIRFILIGVGWLAFVGTSTWVWLVVTETTSWPSSISLHDFAGLAAGLIIATLILAWFLPFLGAARELRRSRWACAIAAETTTRFTWAITGIVLMLQGLSYVALRLAGLVSMPTASTTPSAPVAGAICGGILIAIVGLLYLISSAVVPVANQSYD